MTSKFKHDNDYVWISIGVKIDSSTHFETERESSFFMNLDESPFTLHLIGIQMHATFLGFVRWEGALLLVLNKENQCNGPRIYII